MRKDDLVGQVIDRLCSDLGPEAFDVVDHGDDPYAIGIARRSDHAFRVYICTYPDKAIDFKSETPATDPTIPYSSDGMVESGSYEDLLAAARSHLAG